MTATRIAGIPMMYTRLVENGRFQVTLDDFAAFRHLAEYTAPVGFSSESTRKDVPRAALIEIVRYRLADSIS